MMPNLTYEILSQTRQVITFPDTSVSVGYRIVFIGCDGKATDHIDIKENDYNVANVEKQILAKCEILDAVFALNEQ